MVQVSLDFHCCLEDHLLLVDQGAQACLLVQLGQGDPMVLQVLEDQQDLCFQLVLGVLEDQWDLHFL